MVIPSFKLILGAGLGWVVNAKLRPLWTGKYSR